MRKELLERVNLFLASGEQILKDGREALGEEDPVFDVFERAMAHLVSARENITEFIDKGKIIERF